jgi:predicted small lipoprotein YifL
MVLILTLMVFGVSGCGIKGSPVPPDYAAPPSINDLEYRLTGNQVVLAWTIPPKGATDNYSVVGAKVFRLKQPLKNLPCQDCPQTFSMIRKVPARSESMQFQDTIDNGFGYYYKIVLYDNGNHNGEESNVVYVEY